MCFVTILFHNLDRWKIPLSNFKNIEIQQVSNAMFYENPSPNPSVDRPTWVTVCKHALLVLKPESNIISNVRSEQPDVTLFDRIQSGHDIVSIEVPGENNEDVTIYVPYNKTDKDAWQTFRLRKDGSLLVCLCASHTAKDCETEE